MTTQEKNQMALRYQNKKNQAQGALFEKLIEGGCEYYRLKKVADIEKTPEPMKPTQNLGNGKFIAYYTRAAQADFKGFLYGGLAVNFEAKYTETGKMEQDRVTREQGERLERAYQYGACVFVLCSFGQNRVYRVPWQVWRAMKQHFGHQYITPDEAKPYQIPIGGAGVLLFLDGLEDVHGL